jgi:hypothetical protein
MSSYIFEDVLSLSKTIARHSKHAFGVNRQRTDTGIIVPNHNVDLYTLQNIFKESRHGHKIGFQIVDEVVIVSEQPTEKRKQTDTQRRAQLSRPYEHVPSGTKINLNRISIHTTQIVDWAKTASHTSNDGNIFDTSAILKMIRELANVFIVPKKALAYVDYEKFNKKATELLSAGFDGAIDEFGVVQHANIVGVDTFFRELKHGEPFHADHESEKYRESQRVPIVIIENNGPKNIIIHIHIDVARLLYYDDFRASILSLSQFCTKKTVVPLVTRQGYSKVTIQAPPKGTRIEVPYFTSKLSKYDDRCAELNKKVKMYHAKTFGVSKDHQGFSDQEDGINLVSTRYAESLEKCAPLLLPVGVSLDDFFKRMWIEENGFDEGKYPHWLLTNWDPETPEEKKKRLDFYTKLQKGQYMARVCTDEVDEDDDYQVRRRTNEATDLFDYDSDAEIVEPSRTLPTVPRHQPTSLLPPIENEELDVEEDEHESPPPPQSPTVPDLTQVEICTRQPTIVVEKSGGDEHHKKKRKHHKKHREHRIHEEENVQQ